MAMEEITSPERLQYLKGSPIYSAVFLTQDSTQELLDWVVSKGYDLLPEVKGHHMTIEFKPSNIENLPIGNEVKLFVTGFAADEKCQAVSVSGVYSSNDRPHITVSHTSDVSPKYSNDLLAAGTEPILFGPTLSGIIGVYGKTKG